MPSHKSSGAKPSDVDLIIEAVRNADLTKYSAWSDLDALSSRTCVDEIEVDPAGVTLLDKGRFRGVFNVYVALHYGGINEQELVTSDVFEGTFEGHFEDRQAAIDKLTVNTQPFYE
jgi:hypothetical protein